MGRDQDKVWDHYQTEGLWIFDFAVPRLHYLFRRAKRFAAGRKLRVLNIGIGNGYLEQRCHQEGWESYGLDPNAAAVKALKEKGVSGAVGAIEALPFERGSFDVVFSSEVFEHLLEDLLKSGLQEIGRILKPDGILLGTVPYEEPLEMRTVVCPNCQHVHHAYGHHQSFTAKRLRSLFAEAGLCSVDFRTRAFPGFRRRKFVGKLKSAVWVVVGAFGAQAADSKIVFAARR